MLAIILTYISLKYLFYFIFRVPKFAKDTHFYKLSSSDNHLILILNGKEIMLLEKSTFAFHVMWKIFLENHQHIR